MTHTSTDSFPNTRSSLLSRVRNKSDVESWQEFHSHYSRLVFHVCLKAGLSQQDAEDVSQDTLAAVAKAMPEFQLDRSRGNFRGWLYRIASNKVADFLRQKYRENAVRVANPKDGTAVAFDPSDGDAFQLAWDSEWQSHLLERALDRIKNKVSARSYQIFHLSTVKQWTVDQIRTNLSLGRTQVYLARYRVGLLVKKEIAQLQREMEE